MGLRTEETINLAIKEKRTFKFDRAYDMQSLKSSFSRTWNPVVHGCIARSELSASAIAETGGSDCAPRDPRPTGAAAKVGRGMIFVELIPIALF